MPGEYDVRIGAERPAISGQKPFPITGPIANLPFAPAKSWIAVRGNIPAGEKGQIFQNSVPCQKVVIVNDGGGDLIAGPTGIGLNPPAAGQQTSGGNIAVAAGVLIETEDASTIWAGSLAGTNYTVWIMGLPNVRAPGQ